MTTLNLERSIRRSYLQLAFPNLDDERGNRRAPGMRFGKKPMPTLPISFDRLLCIGALMFLASCSRFEAKVDPKVAPAEKSILAHGNPEPVAASRDSDGVQSEFLESIVLVRPKSAADLQSFLARYDGTVVGDDTIPEPPPELGITLTAEERKPAQFKVRINLAKANADRMSANASAAGLTGQLTFSSDAGMRTFACALDATAAGFRVSRDYVYNSDQAFPVALFATQERQTNPGPPPTFNDPFTNKAYADFGTTGNQSNVFQAWQFIAAHGIQRRATVAIIDSGFYLDPAGLARGTDSDFPPPPLKPFQYDIDFDDPIADGVNSGPPCGGNNPCWWHGTGSAGAAMGIGNNRLGEMGTGGQIADPILLRVNGTKDQRNYAIRTALGWHADVVSMSFGGNCDVYCRKEDRNDNPFDQAVNLGNKVVFVASAGNGYGNPAVGVNVSDAGASTFIHPCIEDHVICVGALNPKANTKIQYSNFGAQVVVFAPTNIPVMSYPPSSGVDSAGNPIPLTLAQADGAPVPQNFGGTSASAPFVAGVVAMMKAVNPDLNHDQVAQILRDTARAGVAPANRMVDAYAALRRAAGSSDIVNDSLEKNDLETTPVNLGSLPPYSRSNLNIDKRDRDYFRFDSPNGSLMMLTLNYPAGLGNVAVHSLESPTGVCEAPVPSAPPAPIATGGQTFVYRVPGGPLRLGLRSDDVNAYNMAITFASDTYPPDDFESNDTVRTAKRLSTRRSVQSASVVYLGDEPRATINATIHSGSDVDFYIVQGARVTMAEKIFIAGAPFLELYGNDSLINLEVFRLNADSSQGAPVGAVNGVRCAPAPLKVQLDEDAYYLVKVSGSPGRYTLRNSVDGDERKFPQIVHDRVYEVLNPGDPVEQVLRFPETFIFTVDGIFSGIQTAGPNVHLRLLDGTGKLLGEGVAGKEGEILSLSAAKSGQMYALEVTAKDANADRPHLDLKWNLAEAKRNSGNLLKNPGAETVQDANEQFADWERIEGRALPSRLSYVEGDDTPSLQDPGSKDRGSRLFASERQGTPSGIQQNIPINEEWRSAINEGRVAAHLSAFLGGNRTAQDRAMVKVTFFDANRRPLGETFLPAVGPRERHDKTGLLPVETNNMVPAGTARVNLELAFGTDQARGIAYADNLELIFSEYLR